MAQHVLPKGRAAATLSGVPSPSPPVPAPPSPSPFLRRIAGPVAALAALGAVSAWVIAADPHEPGRSSPCPVFALTGLYCPGCGGLRSAHALAHGDPAGALEANAPVAAGLLVLSAALVLRLIQAARGRPPGPAVSGAAVPWVLGGLTAVFTAVRNLPAGAALVP